MNTEHKPGHEILARQFYRMPARPCPYIEGRIEQNVFTELSGTESVRHFNALSRSGFRRSHAIAYRPACPGCVACVPVRTVVADFRPGRSLRRVRNSNSDLTGTLQPPLATREQYALFNRYLGARHGDGEMADMSYDDYRAMVEETPLESILVEFRLPDGQLVGGCLADRLGDGFSAVYSFFEPAMGDRGLGSQMILWLIERARKEDLPYIYLGYWIAESRKMAYKKRFSPIEGLGPEGWRVIHP